MQQDLFCDDPMAKLVRMHTIPGIREVRIRLSTISQISIHRTMNIHDIPIIELSLPQQPFRIFGSSHTVSRVAAFHLIKSRWRHVDEQGPCPSNFCVQPRNALPELREPFFIQWQVNSIIHPITCKNQIGFGMFEHSLESLVQIRTWELPSGVSFL